MGHKTLITLVATLFLANTEAHACTAYGVYIDRASSADIRTTIEASYSPEYKDFKDEHLADQSSATLHVFNPAGTEYFDVTFRIEAAANKTSTLVATTSSKALYANPYGMKGLIFWATDLPLNWSLAQAMHEVYANNACTWK